MTSADGRLTAAEATESVNGGEAVGIPSLHDAVSGIAAVLTQGTAVVQEAVCRAKTRTPALSWCFLRSLCCPPVLADQALGGLSALDPGGHIDRLAGLVQRGSLFPQLVGSMIVVVLRVLGQDVPKVLFAVDQQVVEALAA